MEQKDVVIEIRFPFCPGHCVYCHKNALSRDKKLIPAYWKALRREVESTAGELQGSRIAAVHLGYGVPLEGDADQLADLLLFLRRTLPVGPDTRWSMRVLPYQLSAAALTVLRNAGIGQLVLETETCRSDEFAKLQRPYYFAAFDGAVSLLSMVRQQGVHLEVLLGIPGQTADTVRETLTYALKAKPDGIVLHWFDPSQAETPAMQQLYTAAVQCLAQSGMQPYADALHYAFPGRELAFPLAKSRPHERVGFGAGAVTELDGLRYHNTPNLFVYMAHPDEPALIACPEQA